MRTSLSTDFLDDNIKRVKSEISEAAVAAGRRPEDVRLMAVTKTVPASRVLEAVNFGIDLIGENRAQELAEKYDDYKTSGAEIHFIGKLQTNKVRQTVDKVALVQSLCSLKLAKEIDLRAAAAEVAPMRVLVEINIGKEESKSGIFPEMLPDFLAQVAVFKNISVCGIMSVPPAGVSETQTEKYFEALYRLYIDTRAQKPDNVNMDILSMGMSGDFALAVKHGSNLVRIGSAIFGKRV